VGTGVAFGRPSRTWRQPTRATMARSSSPVGVNSLHGLRATPPEGATSGENQPPISIAGRSAASYRWAGRPTRR